MYDKESLETLSNTCHILDDTLNYADCELFQYVFGTLFENYPDAVVEWKQEIKPEGLSVSYTPEVISQEYFEELNAALYDNADTLYRMFGKLPYIVVNIERFNAWKADLEKSYE